jgi:hypothetical protein
VPVQGRPAARARDASLEDADAIGISDNEWNFQTHHRHAHMPGAQARFWYILGAMV